MADSKVTALTATTSPATTDLLYVVTTPGGTPASKKATLADVRTGMQVGMVKIASVGSGATFDFTSIPATYSHLKIVLQARGDTAAAGTAVHMHFNNDTAGNYDSETIDAINTTLTSGAQVATANNFIGGIPANTATANQAGMIEITIPNYASTTFFKNYLAVGGNDQTQLVADQIMRITQGQWRSTAAINRVTIVPGAGNFAAGSTATLYGML